MRLLFLCNSRLWGGAERYSLAVARGMAARGHACFLGAPPGSPTFDAALAAPDVTEVPFNLGPKLSRRSALDLALHWRGYRRVMRNFLDNVTSAFGVDVLHAQFKKEQLLATPAANELGLRVVWTEHGQLPRLFTMTPLAMRRYRRAAGHVTRILCVSDYVRLDLAEHGLAGDHVQVCHNGIDAGEPPGTFERARVRAMLGLEDRHFVVGCTGRLAWPKGQRNLLHAVAAVRARIPDLRLVLVGEGPDRDSLELLTHQLDLARQVLFLGNHDDARALLPAFDVFAAPSLSEGLPYAILEAMAAERPIIGNRVGGVPEALGDGAAGILLDPGRPTLLSDGLERLYHEPRLRHDLGVAARARVLDHFTIARMMDQTEAGFLAATARAGPPSAVRASVAAAS